ncbi:cell adhesion molecule 2 isoform X2 [Peromyscus maniculatus bairdii]|uniref:Cell adhesion molecule 2 isoform X3 n=5 Tax=Muroidea TaxID=337687 RepID=A0ABM1UL99_MICOH|nr:cell adhesion molecule 2 isoform 1 precursor [Mus musculus]XP_006991131.1 cell adhesion molecule 2 isoform X3 [Peromyscus maniculatus bairdii]XP_021040223.1 cell adhesion molecule 2 isoform X3 [Mus caroli]XP_021064550.1 cell adhesion molecule 2 isoform X1 [Mus pahari]XP_026642761.1 cell adhesion molecule 2 isoform X3 [Microtus ochrogaster]XP_028732550.1 cell adhesion molecule 2 isoform X3 [Peromyscus leucopus]XP_031220092.1 cell adhesion molecule 2 isoform X3 [Mastomys coucha]XP_038944382|eukprot:NP_848836.2 cell adhesion molecule 2 isoform 1 precursor [Mus musculus]
MIWKRSAVLRFYSVCGLLLQAAASKSKVKGSQGQFPLTQNVTVVEGGTAILTCRVDQNDNTSLQWSNPAQQTLYFDDKKALRDNRIELVRASWHELSISVSDVSLSDEGQYTCSLFTMPVKTSKAYLTVLGVPEKPQISGFSSPVMEGDLMQLTCKTSGSKPAADIRWFKNDKEIKDVKYLKEEDANRKTFTVSSTLDFRVDRSDDGVAVICRVDHESLNATPQVAMQVLEIHYTPSVKIIPSTPFPQEGQALTLTCESKGKPLPEPVLWTKDGAELPDPDRMVVSGRELNILFLNKTDNGTYRCEATNTIGQSSAEYVLIVHDPNSLAGQNGPDHALIGGIVAVVVFVTLCSIFLLGRYLARHKGTYLTNEAKGAEDAPDADTAIINAEGSQVNAEEKKEYFI